MEATADQAAAGKVPRGPRSATLGLRSRLNVISFILSQFPYKKVKRDKVKLPDRSQKHKYDDHASIAGRRIVDEKY